MNSSNMMLLQDLILSAARSSRLLWELAIKSCRIEIINIYYSDWFFIRILLKESFCMLYTRKKASLVIRNNIWHVRNISWLNVWLIVVANNLGGIMILDQQNYVFAFPTQSLSPTRSEATLEAPTLGRRLIYLII